jgi:hypothetical protein
MVYKDIPLKEARQLFNELKSEETKEDDYIPKIKRKSKITIPAPK